MLTAPGLFLATVSHANVPLTISADDELFHSVATVTARGGDDVQTFSDVAEPNAMLTVTAFSPDPYGEQIAHSRAHGSLLLSDGLVRLGFLGEYSAWGGAGIHSYNCQAQIENDFQLLIGTSPEYPNGTPLAFDISTQTMELDGTPWSSYTWSLVLNGGELTLDPLHLTGQLDVTAGGVVTGSFLFLSGTGNRTVDESGMRRMQINMNLVVPEPSSFALLATGGWLLLARRRRTSCGRSRLAAIAASNRSATSRSSGAPDCQHLTVAAPLGSLTPDCWMGSGSRSVSGEEVQPQHFIQRIR
ncbi:MAG: PEP-CTERM sorting domain-containing protein [Verrucomicrobia bacterium]|nr:PEP-CTERM sorting domain-containing protein [Verrucomicrobiota bacterium]